MSHKLVYFPVYGRGECIRMLATHAKIEFVDERVTGAEFGPRKAAGEFLNGQLPCWFENGKCFNQTMAILRMLGQRQGYYASDAEHMWLIDSVCDTTFDYLAKMYPTQMNKDKQDDKTHATYLEQVQGFADFLHKTLKEHNGKWAAGEKITIADFVVSSLIFSLVYNENLTGGHHYRHAGKEIMEKHHNVKVYVEMMEDELKHYLKHRPAAGF